MLSFGDLKTSPIINIAGVSPSSKDFARRVNEAIRRIMRRGDWRQLVIPIHVCIAGGCVVWPRYVKSVRKMNFCREARVIKNVWYDFLPQLGAPQHCDWFGWIGGNWMRRHVAVDQGKVSVFQDVQGDGRTIRAYLSTPLDANKTIKIFGEDNNGQMLMTQGVGSWTPGITLTLPSSSSGLPYAESTMNVRRIDRVIKDVTEGPVRLYAFNAALNILEDIAIYEPSETNPSYERMRVHTPHSGSCCSGNQSVVALIKLAFVPVVLDSDLVFIDNIDAIKLMIMSIKSEEASDWASKKDCEVECFRELNYDIWDEQRDDQIPVAHGPFGSFSEIVGSQHCF